MRLALGGIAALSILAFGTTWGVAGPPEGNGEQPSVAEMRSRGRAWLASWLERSAAEAELGELALAVIACAGAMDASATRAWPRLADAIAQDDAGAVEALVIAALRLSPDPAHHRLPSKSRADAEGELEQRAGAGDEDVGRARALEFLGTVAETSTRTGSSERLRLDALAGGPFPAARAFAQLQRDPRAHGWLEGLGLAAPARPRELLLAVEVLAAAPDPLALLGGTLDPWPQAIREELEACWLPSVGAFAAEPRRDTPETPGSEVQHEAARADGGATAAALLVLDQLEPWLKLTGMHRADTAGDPSKQPATLSASCEDCHAGSSPSLHRQWLESRHAAAGVGCADCHGTNHSLVFRAEGRVSADVCADCHPKEGLEFARSRHARAMHTLEASTLFARTPPAARASCLACHATGREHIDGGVGSCNACHPGHAFDARAAREPQACTGCHTGLDYPQGDAYRLSKHGALHQSGAGPDHAPTCVTCHMPEGVHDDGFGITIGGSGTGAMLEGAAQPIAMRSIGGAQLEARRSEMVRVCADCHSTRFARTSLRSADALKTEGDRLLTEAAGLLRELAAEGLVDGGELALSLAADPAPPDPGARGAELLRRFHEMWRYHYNGSWKGAYHTSPSVSNLGSGTGMSEDLAWLRNAAAELREEAK